MGGPWVSSAEKCPSPLRKNNIGRDSLYSLRKPDGTAKEEYRHLGIDLKFQHV